MDESKQKIQYDKHSSRKNNFNPWSRKSQRGGHHNHNRPGKEAYSIDPHVGLDDRLVVEYGNKSIDEDKSSGLIIISTQKIFI